MAEEFAFEERFRDGSCIDGNQRLPAPKTVCMDLPRQHILTGAVFAGDEHRGIRRGNFIYRLLDYGHRFGRTPEHGSFASPFEALCHVQGNTLRASLWISPHRFPGLIPGRCQCRYQLLIIPRLDDKVEGPPFHSFDGKGDICIRRKKDHFHLRYHFLDFPGPVETLVAGIDTGIEIHIQQHDIRAELFQRRYKCRG